MLAYLSSTINLGTLSSLCLVWNSWPSTVSAHCLPALEQPSCPSREPQVDCVLLSNHFLHNFGHISLFLHLLPPLQGTEFPPYLCLVLGPFWSYPTKLQKSGQILGYQNSPFESVTREFPDSYLILDGVSPALGIESVLGKHCASEATCPYLNVSRYQYQ